VEDREEEINRKGEEGAEGRKYSSSTFFAFFAFAVKFIHLGGLSY
jgi:hypothetical protein